MAGCGPANAAARKSSPLAEPPDSRPARRSVPGDTPQAQSTVYGAELDALAGGRLPSTGSRDLVRGVLGRFLAAGADHGTLRGDVSAEDVAVALVGVFRASGMDAPHAQVDRLLDLLLAGLRPAG